MAIPWIDNIKKKGQLSVYAGPSLGGGIWAVVFRQALREFNALSRRHQLSVTLTQSGDPPKDSGGADIAVEAASDQISCAYGGASLSESFDGHRMHGRTFIFSRDDKIEKAFIFLPSQPRVNTPRGMRAVGANVMKIIAVHEMVHACGLTNAEHRSSASGPLSRC